MEDVLDISWSANSEHLASGSVDNKLLIWDVTRGRYNTILTDHKGFVQGVAWDPLGQLIASTSSDRVFRTFDVTTKKVVSRSSKAILPFPPDHPFHDTKVRLFHDDTLQTYYRRLQFSPDGLLIAVPAGRIEPEQGKLDTKPLNAVYIYTRYSLKTPACVLPCGDAALVTRWSPRFYTMRADGPKPAFPTQKRMVLAVATKRSVLLYDTQQKRPIALISNIHYTRLTDLTWSPDGSTLVASSTDGFCSIISFSDGELGEVLPAEVHIEQKTSESTETEQPQTETVTEKTMEETKPVPTTPKINSFIKFKAPSEKSPPKKQKVESKEQKTPVKLDVLMETAMPSWSDNSNNEVITPSKDCTPMEVDKEPKATEVMVIEDSEDMKLVYDESTSINKASESEPKESTDTSKSPKAGKSSLKQMDKPENSSNTANKDDGLLKHSKVAEATETEPVPVKSIQGPKTPRRVSFITLSSPKNPKKKC